MSVIGDKIRELLELAEDERGEFLPDLLALDTAGDDAAGVLAGENSARVAELEAAIEELRKQNAELATHNHALANAVPSDPDESLDPGDGDADTDDEDPFDVLFGTDD